MYILGKGLCQQRLEIILLSTPYKMVLGVGKQTNSQRQLQAPGTFGAVQLPPTVEQSGALLASPRVLGTSKNHQGWWSWLPPP